MDGQTNRLVSEWMTNQNSGTEIAARYRIHSYSYTDSLIFYIPTSLEQNHRTIQVLPELKRVVTIA